MKNETIYAIEVGRVSTHKQEVFGDSLEDQLKQLEIARERMSLKYNCEIKIKKTFPFTESASVSLSLQPVQKAITYCRESKNIRFVFIMCIDRFTRAGAVVYGQLKTEFAKIGATIVDTRGVIGTSKINTLEHLGVNYWWSEYSPTYKNELLVAEDSKDEVMRMQTRMIGAAIRYVRIGYWRGSTPLGFETERIDTSEGKRLILRPHHEQSIWFIKMFELRAKGTMSDQQIVEDVNALGFRTKKLNFKDKEDRTKVVVIKGDRQLNVKMLRNYISKPIYAGVNTEKWLIQNGELKPVYLKGGGLIPVKLFNNANRGKVVIVDKEGKPKVYKNKIPLWQQKKLKVNPNYPYKQYVLCPLCRNPFLGSPSRGKLGKYYPAYHCGNKNNEKRNHKYYRIPTEDFEKTIEGFVKKVRFSDKFISNFEQNFLKNWNLRMEQLNRDTINWEKRVIKLREQKSVFEEKLKLATTQSGFQIIEKEIERIKSEIEEATIKRSKVEDTEVDIQTIINSAKYWMEHLEELVLNVPNPLSRATLFGQIFENPPTYEELKNGTPELSPLFALNEAFNTGDSQLSGVDGTRTRNLPRDRRIL